MFCDPFLRQILYRNHKDSRSSGSSLDASFNPSSALSNEPFSSQTKPSDLDPPKKTILVTEETLSSRKAFAFCDYLQAHGFTVLCWNNEEDLVDFNAEETKEDWVSAFDSKDYITLAHKDIARDDVFVFQGEELRGLLGHLQLPRVSRVTNGFFCVDSVNQRIVGALKEVAGARLKVEVVDSLHEQQRDKEEIEKNISRGDLLGAVVKRGDLEALKELISGGIVINEVHGSGPTATALMFACLYGHLEIVKWLLGRGAAPDLKDWHGRTALMYACSNGHLKIVKWLLDSRTSVDSIDDDGTTALMFACLYGHLEIVKCLVGRGAAPDLKDGAGLTALMLACQSGHLEIVKWLLGRGAPVESKDGDGTTALMLACEEGHLEIVKWLVDSGAVIDLKDVDGTTALSLACDGPHPVFMALLVHHGANFCDEEVQKAKNLGLYKSYLLHRGLIINPGRSILESEEDFREICAYPSSLAYCAQRELNVAKVILQSPWLSDRLSTEQWLGILRAYPELREYLVEVHNGYDHQELEDGTFESARMLSVVFGHNCSASLKAYLEEGGQFPHLLHAELLFDFASTSSDESLLLDCFEGLLNDGVSPRLQSITLPIELMEQCQKSIEEKRRMISIVAAEEAPLIQFGRTEKKLPAGLLFSAAYNAEIAPEEKKLVTIEKEALFALSPEERHDSVLQEKLQNDMRMAVVNSFSVRGTKCISIPPIESLYQLIQVVGDEVEGRVRLTLVNQRLLAEVPALPGSYFFPVLAREQQLVNIENGEMFRDQEGRWMLKTNDIEACQVTISVPKKLADDEIINETNINSVDMSALGKKAQEDFGLIKSFFNENYDQWGGENYSCRFRVQDALNEIMRSNKNTRWRFGCNASHAFLSLWQGEVLYKIDLGGSACEIKYTIPEELTRKIAEERETDSAPEYKLSEERKGHETLLKSIIEQHGSCLFYHEDTTKLAATVLSQLAEKGEHSFLIDASSKVDIKQETIKLNHEGQAYIDDLGYLSDFIEFARENSNENFSLVVDFSRLSPAWRVRINSLLDDQPRLQGIEIPGNVRVIGLLEKPSDDDSLTSRFAQDYTCSGDELQIRAGSEGIIEIDELIIDFCGLHHWQEKLFGPIRMVNNQMCWTPSPFIDAVQHGRYSRYRLLNIPYEVRKEVERFIRLAQAKKSFSYNGLIIPFIDSEFVVDYSAFDFESFSGVSCVKQVISGAQDPNAFLINTYLFDSLLQSHAIVGGKYSHLPGLLEQYSKQGLSLYITTPLSDSQWYCLCHYVQEYQVSLQLYLAPNVCFPAGLQFSDVGEEPEEKVEEEEEEEEKEEREAESTKEETGKAIVATLLNEMIEKTARAQLPQVMVTNNARQYCDKYYPDQAENENLYVFDVEDLSIQDLLYKIECQQAGGEFIDFHIERSDLLAVLRNPDATVVLKGIFSKATLANLHRLLDKGDITTPASDEICVRAKLELVVESEALNPEAIDLAWLGDRCQTRSVVVRDKSEVLIEHETACQRDDVVNGALNLDIQAAEGFIDYRKSLLMDMLERRVPWVQLVGETGVGKSSLMDLMREEWSYCCVYNELGSLADWAKDKDCGYKLLFIDESNIEDKQLTFLAPLAPGGSKRILYQGKIYPLDHSHRVIFAKNPKSYGGGRVTQKLFEDHVVPEIHLGDFSPAYIYHKILKPCFENPEALTEDDARRHIEQYLVDKRKSVPVTVRQLQQEVIDATLAVQVGDEVPPRLLEHQTEAYKQLKKFLHVFKAQQTGSIGFNRIGLGGFLITGDSGVGKSETIKIALDELFSKDQWFKLDVSNQDEALEQQLIEACMDGKIIWIDEINVVLQNGLEKTLNALLTGVHPKTGDPLPYPVKILMTGNGVDKEGRSILSGALKARCCSCEMTGSENFRNISSLNGLSSRGLFPVSSEVVEDHLRLRAAAE